MRKLMTCLLLSVAISVFAQPKRMPQGRPTALVNSLLTQMISDSATYDCEANEVPKKITIADHFLNWPAGSFDFPKDRLPKTAEERQKLLQSEDEDYNMVYIFCYPITDTLFSERDRNLMRKQAAENRGMKFRLHSANVRLVNYKTLHDNQICFTFPLFSKNHRYAVVCKYSSSISSGGYDCSQIFYYEHLETGRWKCLYKGGMVINMTRWL